MSLEYDGIIIKMSSGFSHPILYFRHAPKTLHNTINRGHLVGSIRDMKLNLMRLANVLQDDHSERNNNYGELRIADDAFNKLSEAVANNIAEDEDSQSVCRDILKQNNGRMRE